MRAATSLRLLLLPALLLAAGCGDRPELTGPAEPPTADIQEPSPQQTTGSLQDLAYWADGYLLADAPTATSYGPLPSASFNRSGGSMRIVKVAGTTGRYVVRFSGLSALLGGKSNVRVTEVGANLDGLYCKPVGAFLVRDSVEVRCFRLGTGAAANAKFFVQVLGKRDDRAFAFANQPTATNYAPATAGSWNPTGASRIYRDGVGQYRVVFTGLGARLPTGVGGHVQVNGVGTSKVHCKVQTWGGSPDLTVSVGCYSPAGYLADSKFTALFAQPAAHLAYVWADSPTTAQYRPYSVYASNPAGGAMTITRYGVGAYEVTWTGVDAAIRDFGNVQVTAWGESSTQCKVTGLGNEWVTLQCIAGNGVAVDAQYTVLLGS